MLHNPVQSSDDTEADAKALASFRLNPPAFLSVSIKRKTSR